MVAVMTPRFLIALLPLTFGCPGPDTGETDGPEGTELPCDERDADDDGINACDDCDDARSEAFPGAPEQCNGLDDDCDGDLDPSEVDANSDDLPDCWACDEAGYFELVRDTSDGDLDDVLADEMAGLRCNYSDTGTWMFTRLDIDDGEVECVYTGRRTPVNGVRPDSNNDMNIEHTWPQSQGAGDLPMKCDLHHLFPSDVDANTARANHPFGLVANVDGFNEGGSRLGRDGRGDTVFEPRDAHKGDVARAMLYMSLEYGWTLPAAQRELFVTWAAEDPADEADIDRSLRIGEQQAFANPLVVCPTTVERLFD